MAFVACTLLASFISNYIVPASDLGEKVKTNSYTLYMISLADSKLEKEAEMLCEDYQKIGAGGFVWKSEDYYHVISSAYLNKNDATLVQNSIKTNQNIESKLIEVKFNGIEIYQTLDANENKVMTKAGNLFYNYYLSLFDIAVSYDTFVYNEISARLAVNNLHSSLLETIANFETVFKDNLSSQEISPLYCSLLKAKEISEDLCGGEKLNSNQTYSSLLKYRYLQMLDLQKSLEQDM